MRKGLRNIVATAILSCGLVGANSAQAFVWPTFGAMEVGSELNSVVTGVSKVVAAKAQIDGYIKTFTAIGDQATMVAKYAKDIKQSITSVKDSVEQLDGVVREATNSISETITTINEELDNAAGEKLQIAENTVNAIESMIN